MADPLPTDATLADEHTLVITWTDGSVRRYDLQQLRAQCACAQCVDEWTGVVRVRPEQFEGIGLKALEEVGSYAIRITFTDGHDIGLYTFKRLRQLGEPGAPA